MKVYSLYQNDTYIASFSKKETAIEYGKENYMDGWECNVIEEYLSKTPYNMHIGHPYTPLTSSQPIPYTPLTPSQPIPCTAGITLLPGTDHIKTNPGTYPDIYCGVKADA